MILAVVLALAQGGSGLGNSAKADMLRLHREATHPRVTLLHDQGLRWLHSPVTVLHNGFKRLLRLQNGLYVWQL